MGLESDIKFATFKLTIDFLMTVRRNHNLQRRDDSALAKAILVLLDLSAFYDAQAGSGVANPDLFQK